jgi:hypothetical protein
MFFSHSTTFAVAWCDQQQLTQQNDPATLKSIILCFIPLPFHILKNVWGLFLPSEIQYKHLNLLTITKSCLECGSYDEWFVFIFT